jgi:hypothetical protein
MANSIKYGHLFEGAEAEVAQLGKARAWNLVAFASELVALCASGVQISPSALPHVHSLIDTKCDSSSPLLKFWGRND